MDIYAARETAANWVLVIACGGWDAMPCDYSRWVVRKDIFAGDVQ